MLRRPRPRYGSVSVPTSAARSTRTTSAPRSDSTMPQNGTPPRAAISTTRTPVSGPLVTTGPRGSEPRSVDADATVLHVPRTPLVHEVVVVPAGCLDDELRLGLRRDDEEPALLGGVDAVDRDDRVEGEVHPSLPRLERGAHRAAAGHRLVGAALERRPTVGERLDPAVDVTVLVGAAVPGVELLDRRTRGERVQRGLLRVAERHLAPLGSNFEFNA